jgi:hypothetical protein
MELGVSEAEVRSMLKISGNELEAGRVLQLAVLQDQAA